MNRAVLLCFALTAACGGDDDGSIEPPFPENYADSFTEVRDCRRSGDHNLNYIRVLTDSAALPVYRDRTGEFPAGSVIIKEEYDFADGDCALDIVRWTVMVKDGPGSSEDTLGWAWYDMNAEGAREVTGENVPACYGCHTLCDGTDVGYRFTCAEDDGGS